jgi:acyl dehydratase
MFDRKHIGHRFGPVTIEVEKGPMRLFAKAIGESRPVCVDEQAAHASGLRSLLAPPTYIYCLESLGHCTDELAQLLEIGDAVHLHGEQGFEYFESVCAGDQLTFQQTVTDIYSKRDGQLNFVVTETRVTNHLAQHVANIRSTSLVNRAPT